jgi:hypothetical protein
MEEGIEWPLRSRSVRSVVEDFPDARLALFVSPVG